MDKLYNSIVYLLATLLMIWVFNIFNWVWLRPKKLEKCLRRQGFRGNSYKLLFGDMKDWSIMVKKANFKPIDLTNDVVSRVISALHHCIKNHGNNSFIWMGPTPRVNIAEPGLIIEILTKSSMFLKPEGSSLGKLLATGLARYDGEKWAKHRKIINPVFHIEKLKLMLPAFYESCSEMVTKWEEMVSQQGSCEIDAWPHLQTLTANVISRTAFSCNYEDGRRIFLLQREQASLLMKAAASQYIPGWRFIPTNRKKRMGIIWKEVHGLLRDMISKRMETMKVGVTCNNDLLDILLKSNWKEIQDHGNNKKLGMSIDDVIEECKLFYLAGQDTTSVLLVWVMVLLSKHQDWQQRAREEVQHFFGNRNPDFDGLSRLKTVHMILLEVLRLYPPLIAQARTIRQDVNLGDLHLPTGVEVLLPTIMVHRDNKIWGDDANEFSPERFAEGISKATKNQVSFFPFGWGPRICVGQNFAMLEAKMTIAMIVRCFRFELSSSYVHAPVTNITLQPQHGAYLILHKL